MNTEIRRLQMLNDLISLTLDAINQRAVAGTTALQGGLSHTPYYGWDTRGLAHTPYVHDPRFIATDPRFAYDPRFVAADPRFVAADPRIGVQNWGLSHTAVDPRFVHAPRNYWMDPRVTFANYVW